MILYFAGSDSNGINSRMIQQLGGSKLECFYYMRDLEPLEYPRLIMDSGGFQARHKNEKLDIAEYAEYLNRYKIENAFNLDTNDLEETLANQEYLDSHCKTTILPVYHYSDHLNGDKWLLDKYIKDYKYIAVGGVAGVTATKEGLHGFYKDVFFKTRDITKVHGLGITTIKTLEYFPWYSVDSTTWVNPSKYGSTRTTKNPLLEEFYRKRIDWKVRVYRELKWFMKFEQYLTRLWEKRGVKWS